MSAAGTVAKIVIIGLVILVLCLIVSPFLPPLVRARSGPRLTLLTPEASKHCFEASGVKFE